MTTGSENERSRTHKPLLRLVAAILDGGAFSATSAGKRAQVGVAAARRYLEMMEESLPGVRLVRKNPATWRYFKKTERPPKPLTLGALAVAHSLLASLRGSVLDEILTEFITQVRNEIEDPKYLNVDISRMFYAHARSVRIRNLNPDLVDEIVRAILESQILTADYRSFEGKAERLRFRPYTLITWEEGLYCLGRCELSSIQANVGRTKLYNMARFSEVKLAGRKFLYPSADEYDPRSLMRHCLGVFLPQPGCDVPTEEVILEFSARWAAYVKDHDFHETQKYISYDDATGTARISMLVHSNYDLVRWLRGFGKEVAILSPAAVRAWVKSGEGADYVPPPREPEDIVS